MLFEHALLLMLGFPLSEDATEWYAGCDSYLVDQSLIWDKLIEEWGTTVALPEVRE